MKNCNTLRRYASSLNTGQFLHRINVAIGERRKSTAALATVDNDESGRNLEDECVWGRGEGCMMFESVCGFVFGAVLLMARAGIYS